MKYMKERKKTDFYINPEITNTHIYIIYKIIYIYKYIDIDR